MCGRFGIADDAVSMVNAFGIDPSITIFENLGACMPRYNVAPTDQIPVIFEKNNRRQAHSMRWGLLPYQTRSIHGRSALDENGKSLNTPINARAETIDSKDSFKLSFERRRCLIPASGFYEWKKTNFSKIPHWIHLLNQRWMALAGIYTWWKAPSQEWIPSCTIITTNPNSLLESIHDRMPVILTPGSYDMWLSSGGTNLSELKEILVPYAAKEMSAHPVSTDVNKTVNNRPDLVNPV
ncbi:MAG: hypothetical protein CL896_03760 [Dehalococcoidia bacterium]|nr:hypothetical protein [Dehalococcoidia bacterium]